MAVDRAGRVRDRRRDRVPAVSRLRAYVVVGALVLLSAGCQFGALVVAR